MELSRKDIGVLYGLVRAEMFRLQEVAPSLFSARFQNQLEQLSAALKEEFQRLPIPR